MLQNAQGCFRVLILAGPKYFEPAPNIYFSFCFGGAGPKYFEPALRADVPAQNILGRQELALVRAGTVEADFCGLSVGTVSAGLSVPPAVLLHPPPQGLGGPESQDSENSEF